MAENQVLLEPGVGESSLQELGLEGAILYSSLALKKHHPPEDLHGINCPMEQSGTRSSFALKETGDSDKMDKRKAIPPPVSFQYTLLTRLTSCQLSYEKC